ncbi:MAG: hypothetical protein AB1324_04155 [Candidatus Micrarchaeota archaeon]
MKITQQTAIGAVFVVLAIAVIYFVFLGPGKYDDFARCLSDKGAKMYGAFWCPHCNEQKEMFGGSWKYAPYVECSNPDRTQKELCNAEGITGYPTWRFAGGKEETGLMTFEELSAATGCPLPE